MKAKILIILTIILTIGAQCANGQEIFDAIRKYRVERIKKKKIQNPLTPRQKRQLIWEYLSW